MINITRLLSFSDIVSDLGGRAFTLSAVVGKLAELQEDAVREKVAFDILARVRLLTGFLETLKTNRQLTPDTLIDEDFSDLIKMNAAILAFAISDISVKENVEMLQSFLIKLVRSKKYDVSKLKQDCQIIMGDNSELEYRERLMKELVSTPIPYNDVLPLYEGFPELFTYLDAGSTDVMSAAVTADIKSINIYDVIEVIYGICQRRALSEYVQSGSPNAAINVYSVQFSRVLEFVDVDLEQYLDRATDSLISIEEVMV